MWEPLPDPRHPLTLPAPVRGGPPRFPPAPPGTGAGGGGRGEHRPEPSRTLEMCLTGAHGSASALTTLLNSLEQLVLSGDEEPARDCIARTAFEMHSRLRESLRHLEACLLEHRLPQGFLPGRPPRDWDRIREHLLRLNELGVPVSHLRRGELRHFAGEAQAPDWTWQLALARGQRWPGPVYRLPLPDTLSGEDLAAVSGLDLTLAVARGIKAALGSEEVPVTAEVLEQQVCLPLAAIQLALAQPPVLRSPGAAHLKRSPDLDLKNLLMDHLSDGLNQLAVIRTIFETLELCPDDAELRGELRSMQEPERVNVAAGLLALEKALQLLSPEEGWRAAGRFRRVLERMREDPRKLEFITRVYRFDFRADPATWDDDGPVREFDRLFPALAGLDGDALSRAHPQVVALMVVGQLRLAVDRPQCLESSRTFMRKVGLPYYAVLAVTQFAALGGPL